MTISKVIEITDELMPNAFSDDRKVSWLSTLDGKIWNEVISTHHNHKHPHRPFPPQNPLDQDIRPRPCPEEEKKFEPYTDTSAELLVEFPYAEDIYVFYLQATMALHNFETQKYNQFITMFNARYEEWAAWYNRTHLPKGKPRLRW